MSERTGGSVPAQRNAGEKVWAYPGRWVFDLKLLQRGPPRGPHLLLRVLRGEKIDWQAIEEE